MTLVDLSFLNTCDYHLIATAGGAKNLADAEGVKTQESFYDSVSELDHRKAVVSTCIDFRFWPSYLRHLSHNPPSGMLLTTHYDCGACGGSARFDNDHGKEHSFHSEILHKARHAVVHRLFGRRSVDTSFVDSDFKGIQEKTCEAMVVSCCEAPHWQRAFKIVHRWGVRTFDIFTAFGGAGRLMREQRTAEHLIENINIARALHKIKKVYLTGHPGQCSSHTDLLDACAKLKRAFGDLKVKVVWTGEPKLHSVT